MTSSLTRRLWWPGNYWQPPLEADVDRVAEKISA
jgi:hypothetical protein